MNRVQMGVVNLVCLVALLGCVFAAGRAVPITPPRPYVLVIATLTGPTAIAFDSEKSCLMASAEIRQVYAVAPAFKCVEK